MMAQLTRDESYLADENIVKTLTAPATVFYEYAADDGKLLKTAAKRIDRLAKDRDALLVALANIMNKDAITDLETGVMVYGRFAKLARAAIAAAEATDQQTEKVA